MRESVYSPKFPKVGKMATVRNGTEQSGIKNHLCKLWNRSCGSYLFCDDVQKFFIKLDSKYKETLCVHFGIDLMTVTAQSQESMERESHQ